MLILCNFGTSISFPLVVVDILMGLRTGVSTMTMYRISSAILFTYNCHTSNNYYNKIPPFLFEVVEDRFVRLDCYHPTHSDWELMKFINAMFPICAPVYIFLFLFNLFTTYTFFTQFCLRSVLLNKFSWTSIW